MADAVELVDIVESMVDDGVLVDVLETVLVAVTLPCYMLGAEPDEINEKHTMLVPPLGVVLVLIPVPLKQPVDPQLAVVSSPTRG